MWGWFIDLHARRNFDGSTGLSQPIGWTDIKAWSDVTETPLATHETRLLVAIDNLFLNEERKARSAAEKQHAQKAKSKRTK